MASAPGLAQYPGDMKLAINGGNRTIEKGAHAHYPQITDEDKAAVMAVMDTGVLWGKHAPQVKGLESDWAEYVGTEYCVATNSGTAALHIGAAAAGIGPGDELIAPTYSFLSTASCALQANGVPVFVDIKPDTFTIDPAKIEERITERTKAIVAVHIHGLPADMDEIMAIAEKHGLYVIEDACQAHGATYKGKKTGNLGHMAAFSLNASKGIPSGEGGLFTTNDVTLRDKADSVAVFGEVLSPDGPRAYNAKAMGWMYRTQEIPAAIARSQLKRLDAGNAIRNANAARLTAGLSKIAGIIVPHVPEDRTHAWHMYRLSLDTEVLNPELPTKAVRDLLMKALNAEGLDMELWSGSIPAQELFQKQEGYGKGCPWTCPYGSGDVTYDLAQYKVTGESLNRSMATWSPLQPPHTEDMVDKYIEGFQKVFDNLDQVWAKADG